MEQQQSFSSNQSKELHKQGRLPHLHKSFHSSSNDSSTNYENNYSDSFSFDICFPKFKRSKSMKKSYISQQIDKIKEERNEDDSFHSNFSERKKIYINSIMPKDNLFFERKKLFKEPLNFTSQMELIPEIEDDNLAFQSPRIKLLRDHKEDKQIKQNIQNSSFRKEPIPENEIIKEENKEYCFEEFVRKFESFIDKEEPPENNNNNLQILDNIPDIIPESNIEDDIHDSAKEIIRSNSLNINKKRFIDELDFINKNEMNLKEFDVDDAINEIDEFNNKDKKENGSDDNNENNSKEKNGSSSEEQD